ncbi:AbfB domain-containing protein [Streptomyces sp. NPDC001678]|uniref:AbfB domain-containing protein n=1 Tax=Streptomyces sp. NPDC001678 TaxID=3364599 RepID=UPI00368CFD8A
MHNRHTNSARARSVLMRGIVTTTALAAVAGVAAPSLVMATPAAAASSTGDVATDEMQRERALSVVKLEATGEYIALSDRDLIYAIWMKARDLGEEWTAVRLAAENALASTSGADYAEFIITGIHKAHRDDETRNTERADADRAARLAKSQALIAVGITSTPDLLALSDDNFVRAIMNNSAPGSEVQKAATAALASDAAAWREFITNGAREAHQRDVAAEIKALEEKNREEAQRRAELAARKSAAALFGVTPSEAMLTLGDDNFIRELLKTVPDDAKSTELYLAAQKAVLSSDKAEWNKFIHTGAEAAYKRDDEARRKKVADSNRLRAQEIMAAADKTGMYPHLVATAKKALAGSDEDVARFLKDGQFRALRQSFQAANAKLSGFYLRQSDVDGGEAFIAPVGAKSKQADREDATWVVVPALANGQSGCYSLESVRKPGYYLAQKDLRVRMTANDRSAQFAKDATWCARKALAGSGTSFESASQPGRWLRQYQGDVYAADKSGKNRADVEKDFAQDATWKISTPLAR